MAKAVLFHTLFVTDQQTLHGDRICPFVVQGTGRFRIVGNAVGPMTVHSGGAVDVIGSLIGPVTLMSGSALTVAGTLMGPVDVSAGARMTITRTGSVLGQLHINGDVVSYGRRIDHLTGSGHLSDYGTVLRPVMMNGQLTYRV